MRRFGVAVIAVFLALCGAASATPPNTPTITEPGTDNMVLNAADVHMEAPTFSDPDGNTHTCTDWEIVTVSPAAGRLDGTLRRRTSRGSTSTSATARS